jgi:hypothetical protein
MLNMHNMPHGTEKNMQQATLLGHLYAQVMLSTYWVAVLLSQWFCFHLKMHSTPSPASSPVSVLII